MAETQFHIYEVQLQDSASGTTIAVAGGTVYVATADDAAKATIYNPDTNLAMANPLTPTRGKIRFMTLATVETVDLYGMAPGGQAFVRRGVAPGAVQEIYIDTGRAEQTLTIPWATSDVVHSVEQDTGFDLPRNALVSPFVSLLVTAIDATEDIDVGLLSSESGGDADGFLDAASIATLGTVRGALAGTDTLGALLKEDTNAGSVLVPASYVVGATARSVTYTLSMNADTGKGFISIPYRLALAA
ncbi:hypothetical protein [Falsiroseomonas tokyonensis]|uniref:DUF4394 domain-containing protein n=1 Tax=Falsiroseomonas tokyonensis TaxID=430521 RepID=A0ABV7C0K8_9PROT|nr:hypothetical protein [Falsiroseomonas tokyonensis]MBU8540184.1 hypothetical protein [Falsiroseomonas tokyonensis]